MESVAIPCDSLILDGDLTVPAEPAGVVVFAHGSGSSRHSSRNRFVARRLNDGGLATLLMDLLTEEEEQEDVETQHLRFDISLLARRLLAAVNWLRYEPELRDLPVGIFGASTGAAAALTAAAVEPERIQAVVSRGGRPDLAGEALSQVVCPTLLVVGGADSVVLDLNETARAKLRNAERRMEIVPGATHLFPEPGALEQVADLAGDWFLRHFQDPET